MKICQRRMETLLVCAGLFLSVLPHVWSMAVMTEITTDSQQQIQYPRAHTTFNRSHVSLRPSYVRSTDYNFNRDLETTIRWEFINDFGVWGVMFDSFSIPSSADCSADYFSIWDPSERCSNLTTKFCSDSIPKKFVSCSSKIVIEYHSEAPQIAPHFMFRAVHGNNKSVVQTRFETKFIPPSGFENEKLIMDSEEEKVVIISLSVILPVALAILGMLAFILAKHTQQNKTSSQENILPTKCPSSKKYVHSGSEKDSTVVVKLFVDEDEDKKDKKKTVVKPNKVRLQDLRSERVPLNSYAEMPINNIQICTSVAESDVAKEEVEFEDRPTGYLGLM